MLSLRARDDILRELLDDAVLDDAALRRNLADIRRINGLLGWRQLAVREVARLVRERGQRSFSLLDIASGSADIPIAIARWAAADGLDAHIVASDLSPQIVAIARDQAAGVPGVTIERLDALALPYPDGSFDLTLCTLALHHFDAPLAAELLAEMARVGRQAVVFDLVRSPLAWWACLLMTRALPMDPMTRHDAPASVRRGYTAVEARRLAEAAGIRGASVRVGIPFRLVMVADGVPSAGAPATSPAAMTAEEIS
ncbi:MAG TPA: methyltransferase domain-containing protein [Ktedonobacterales bacterium]